MKLSLSVRVAESFSDKEKATLTIDELIGLAKDNGYEAICMRASQAGTHSEPKTVGKKSETFAGAPWNACAYSPKTQMSGRLR